MKTKITDTRKEGTGQVLLGLDSVVVFEHDGVEYRAKLGSTISIQRADEFGVTIDVSLEEEVGKAVEELKEYFKKGEK